MIVVSRVLGLITIQDLGRPGHMHESVPVGGALVRSRLVAANRHAGNPDGTPALEVLGRATLRAEADVVVATDSSPAYPMHAGEQLDICGTPSVCYLAVRGGFAVPRVLDGFGAFTWARLGPILRSGDRLAIGHAHADAAEPVPTFEPGQAIRVIAGPDLAAFVDIAPLASAPYRVLPETDRVGTRLRGPRLERVASYVPRSRPMACGAIEVPPDGQPIVLGREHPITGGYPIAGVVAYDDLDRLFATPLGSEVRFELTTSAR